MKNWKDLNELFKELEKTKYVVMRNYENFGLPNFLNEHCDIDFLCDDLVKFVSVSKAMPRQKFNDMVHYKIMIDNQNVPIDIREIGDGYMDSKWEKDILDNRIINNEKFYVMNDKNYYYSLLYHALIQKYEIAEDYRIKMSQLRKKLNIKDNGIYEIEELENFMRKNEYKYTYPRYLGAILNIEKCSKDLVKSNKLKEISRFVYNIFERK